MILRSLFTTFGVGLVVAALVVGCGGSDARHDIAATYSPTSLAQELVFRYKMLDPNKRDVARPAPPRRPEKSASKEAKAATKEAEATTLDDVVRDIRAKAALVPGMTTAEAIQQTAAAIDKDASLAEPERQTITDRLRAPGE